MEVNPGICKLYEQNLQYFARKNIPMSCYRPIAPNLKDRIKEVEWEDLDPDVYSGLLRAIVIQYQYLSKASDVTIEENLGRARDGIARKIRVFRRAKLYLAGQIRLNEGRTEPEPYWIVQYGFDVISPDNPDPFYRCEQIRGGFDWLEADLSLYIASALSKTLIKTLSRVVWPSNKGQYLREIDGILFVENIDRRGWVELNVIDTNVPLTDTVCVFDFKKSSR